MTIEIAQNILIFCCDEIKTLEYIGPQDFRGFGHEFEKAYTIARISSSTRYYRIISYRFSDLNFIVCHETDGYINTSTRTSSSKAKILTQDDLSSIVGALSLSPANSSPGIIPTGSKLIIKEEGQVVPLGSTLEINTRVSHKSLEIQEVAPQLWVSQTPKLVRSYHQNGTFQRLVVKDVAAVIKSWEERKQDKLRALAALIRKIINLVKECGGNAVLKYNIEGDKLVICKVERKEMLLKDLYLKQDDVPNLGAEIDTRNDGLLGPKIAQIKQESMSMVFDIRNIREHRANVETLQMRITRNDLKATIRIGDMDYSAHVVSKMLYLASFVQL